MKFTLAWLKEHLETEASLDEIVDGLIGVGLEVEEVSDPAAKLAGFTVARVKEARQHPNADRLRVCDVETASGLVQVVCGAPNAATGLVGIFAPPGTHIPGTGLDLEVGSIRGVESRGMLCSERELQLSDEHTGIIELAGDFAIGTPAARALGMDDPMIYVKVTPNRPDALGVYGIARDLAAKGLGRLKPLDVKPVKGSYKSPIDVKLTLRRSRQRPLPAVHRPAFSRDQERAVARMAAAAPHRHRAQAHLGAGRYHQLRHLRLWPAPARLRCGQGEGRHPSAPCQGGRDAGGARRQDLYDSTTA